MTESNSEVLAAVGRLIGICTNGAAAGGGLSAVALRSALDELDAVEVPAPSPVKAAAIVTGELFFDAATTTPAAFDSAMLSAMGALQVLFAVLRAAVERDAHNMLEGMA